MAACGSLNSIEDKIVLPDAPLELGSLHVMNWQEIIALAIVALAACLLLRSVFRRPAPLQAHGNPCGCSAVGAGGNKASIIVRSRKGERPQVIVKMP